MSNIDLGPVTIGLASVPPPSATARPTPFSSNTYASVSEAQRHTSLALRAPARVPGGATLVDVSVLNAPRQMAVLTFDDRVRGASLIIVYSPIPEDKDTQLCVGDSLEPTSVGDQPAALVELHDDSRQESPSQTTVVWVRESTLCQVIGVGLTRADLIQVAESI